MRRLTGLRPTAPTALPVVTLCVVLAWVGCRPASKKTTLSFATGSTLGLYYPLGGGLSSIWSKNIPYINMKAETTAGSVTNLIQVAKKESDIGFTQGDALESALAGRGRFPEPLELAILGRLYPNLLHLIALKGSGIQSIQDLRGKRVSVGPPGSGNAVTTWNVLDAVGIAESDFSVRQLNYTQTTNGIKDGTLDAGFIAGGIGLPAVVELAVARDMVLVAFSEEEIASISGKISAYSGFVVPPGIYRGVDDSVLVPTLWNMLIVHRDMDESLAYELIETLFDHREALEAVSSVARFMTPETARDVGGLGLHPGAERYYAERLRE